VRPAKLNIFYVDENPSECARALSDIHLACAPVHVAQILSRVPLDNSIYQTVNPITPNGYRSHAMSLSPWVFWAKVKWENYKWMTDYYASLAVEFEHRHKRVHLTYQNEERTSEFIRGLSQLRFDTTSTYPAPYDLCGGAHFDMGLSNIDGSWITPESNEYHRYLKGEYLQVVSSHPPLIAAYRYYYAQRKSLTRKWTNRAPPEWLVDYNYSIGRVLITERNKKGLVSRVEKGASICDSGPGAGTEIVSEWLS
jgi:hypothetical protein